MSVACVILAAGRSQRFGTPKALAQWRGNPFARRIAEEAERAGLFPRLMVLGHAWRTVRRALGQVSAEFVVNRDYDKGQFSSLQTALARLRGQCNGAVICLVDQPQVTSRVLRQIAAEIEAKSDLLIAPVVGGRGVHPVGIGARWFDAVLELPPESTLRDFFRKHRQYVLRPELDEPLLTLDVDTPEDLRKLEAAWALREMGRGLSGQG